MDKNLLIVQVLENENYKVTIRYDEFPESPRHMNDNLGTFYTWTRANKSPDAHSYATPRDFMEDLASEFVDISDEDIENVSDEQLMDIIRKYCVILPVFKYEHGGVIYNTTGFSCPWDSGQVGFIFVRKTDACKKYENKDISSNLLETIENVLRAEVEEYSHYANGSVFEVLVEKKVPHWAEDDPERPDDYVFDPNDENTYDLIEVELVSGFLGSDFETNGIKEYIPQELHDQL